MKKLLLLTLLLSSFACTPRQGKQPPSVPPKETGPSASFVPPKNIILMIGDGMGIAQITAGMYTNGNKLNLEQFTFVGLQKSYASDNLITDSAAAATALASGVKTYNGAIGMDKNGRAVKTILEEAKAEGLAAGLVVTSSITHATPACFYAHVKDRAYMEEIAVALVNSGVDFFVGGGKKYFDRRKDGVDMIATLGSKGYAMNDFLRKDFNDISINFDNKFGYFTADSEPLPFSQGRDYLVQASKTAATYLSGKSDKGFFLMIEGSQIDWGGHANDPNYIISEMLDFDKAIGVILEFAKEDGETLVIVTSDHETGGYAINPGSKMDSLISDFTTDRHTATMIPVFAWGPGAELFGGMYENTAIYDKMKLAFGFGKTLQNGQ